MKEKYLSKMWEIDRGYTLSVVQKHGGYSRLKKAFSMDRDSIVNEVKVSNLRGRGGAGFPTGIKWSFMPKESNVPMHLTVNGDEGEPATFKDRYILELDPHLLIEGCIITGFTLGLSSAYIYIRGELQLALRRMQNAVDEAYAAGYLGKNIQGTGFDYDIIVHPSGGAYICGEETAMIEGLEGKPGKPRMKPPFPAVVGAFQRPTLVNNVESIASIPWIIEKGGQWFADLGVEKNGGPKLFGLSGCIKKPGVYEAPLGITVRELLEDYGGGLLDGSELKAFIPGGSSCRVMLPESIDTPMSIEALAAAGSSMGTACVTFLDQNVCMVRLISRLVHFYHHESCGQCTPCREGSGWTARILDKIENGDACLQDLDLLREVTGNIMGNTICALGDSITVPVHSYLDHFYQEFVDHINNHGCNYPKWWSRENDRCERFARRAKAPGLPPKVVVADLA